MGTESGLKVLQFDSMIHSKSACYQEQLHKARLAETNAVEGAWAQMGLIQLSCTTEQVPKKYCARDSQVNHPENNHTPGIYELWVHAAS